MKKLKDNIFSIVLWVVMVSVLMIPLFSQHSKWVNWSLEQKAWATNYWAGANGDITADNVWYTLPAGTACAGSGTVTSGITVLQASNYIIANGCTMTVANTNSGFTVGGISTDVVGGGVAGGSITRNISTATGAPTDTIGTITAGTSHGLIIAGTTTLNPALTILTTSVTGSSTAGNRYGIIDGHASTGVVKIGNEANPNVVARCISGYGIQGAVTTTKVYGSCVGGTGDTAVGCMTVTLIGNNIFTLGVSGLGYNSVYDYADSPINSYWKVWMGGTSYMYMIKDPGVANVSSGFSYGNSDGGPLTGTLSTGGGGSSVGY
jgi:hypothetical protein